MKLILTAAMLLAATANSARGANQEVLLFVADLKGQLVAPSPVETAATAKATGALVGNRFIVHGSFSGLSSGLRDLATKPDDPGVHLHKGAPGIVIPYFHGLQVKLNADQRSGIFYGVATLSDDQKKALLASETYVDIHTVKYGPGEVRDQWRPLDARAAAAAFALMGASRPAPDETRGACHSSKTRTH